MKAVFQLIMRKFLFFYTFGIHAAEEKNAEEKIKKRYKNKEKNNESNEK